MATPSNRGENGHLAMEESSRARVGVCPIHGSVTPFIVGGRWKCPSCGVYIRKQDRLQAGSFPRIVQRTSDETFWRLEVHCILEATAAKLRELPEHVQALVDHRIVMDWIEWTDAVHMTLPETELDGAVRRINERAAKLVGASQLFPDLATLEAECSDREGQRDRLRSEEAALKESVDYWEGRARKLNSSIRSAESTTGMSLTEVYQQLSRFSEMRGETERLMDFSNRLNQERWSAQACLGQLQREISRCANEVQRLSQLAKEEWETLSDRLTTEDLIKLHRMQQKKRFEKRREELRKRVTARFSSGTAQGV